VVGGLGGLLIAKKEKKFAFPGNGRLRGKRLQSFRLVLKMKSWLLSSGQKGGIARSWSDLHGIRECSDSKTNGRAFRSGSMTKDVANDGPAEGPEEI